VAHSGNLGKTVEKRRQLKRIAGLPEKGTIFTRIGQNLMHFMKDVTKKG